MADLARAQARYEAARTFFVGLLVAVVLVSLALVILIGVDVRKQGRDAVADRAALREQSQKINALLETQARNDSMRDAVIDKAVQRIAAEQYRALVAHDNRTEKLLQRTLALTNAEVNGAGNQEQQVIAPLLPPALRPAPAPKPVAPKPKRTFGPSTGVAPAPAPPPCETAGRSDRCKK